MIYDKLKIISKERNESVNSIIEKSGLPTSIIGRFKKESDPKISTIIKLSIYTNKSIEWLIEGEKSRVEEDLKK